MISLELLLDLSFRPSQFSVFLPPGLVNFSHLFRRFLSCHLSGGTFLVKPLVTPGLGSFLSLSVLGTDFPDFLSSRKGTHRLLLEEFIQIGLRVLTRSL